jgi:hypothetical protein
LEVLNELQIRNGNAYGWLKELEEYRLIVRIPSPSIKKSDCFYAVGSLGSAPFPESPDVDQGNHHSIPAPAPRRANRRLLSQAKVEHAVLWSLVRERYNDEFADVRTVGRHLLNVASEQQVRAALTYLVECGLARDCSAPSQEHHEPTREGIQKIEGLEKAKASYVSRLNIHGPKWLLSQSAHDAELQSKLAKPADVTAVEAVPVGAGYNSAATGPININVSPSFQNNSGAASTSNDELARSAKNAGWFGASGTWVGVLVAVVGALVALWIAGKL